jgi:hypothetical protein
MRKEIICKIMLLSMMSGIVCLQACHQPNTGAKIIVRHMAELHSNGSVLYVDPADSRQVMKADCSEAFVAYRIGFEDSLTSDKKIEQARNVYYDLRMASDWKAVIGSDSISPVFYQPVTRLNKVSKEGILVFELPAGRRPDALVFDDSFGDWQKQIIALNPHLK